jgi:hypothetical protein
MTDNNTGREEENISARSRSPAWLAEGAVAGVLLCLHVTLIWLQRAPGVTTGQDDATYMLLARSLKHGAYFDAYLVGAPAHAQYPPGYPAVLALLGSVFGERYDAFVAWNLAASVAALALIYVLARRRWSSWLALSLLGLMAVSPQTLYTASRVASEPTFLLALAILLWSLEERSAGWVHDVLTPIFALVTFLVRTAGAAFVGGLPLYWALRRDWRRVLYSGALMVAPVAGWLGWTYRAHEHTIGDSYWTAAASSWAPGDGHHAENARIRAVAGTPARVAENLKDYLLEGIPTTAAFPMIGGTMVDNVAWLVVTVVGLLTGAVILWLRWPSAAVLTGSYIALLAVWLWPIPRFLLPVLPMLLLMLLLGAEAISRRWLRQPLLLPLSLTLVLGATAAAEDSTRIRDVRSCGRGLNSTANGCYPVEQIALFRAASDLRARAMPNEHTVAGKTATFGFLTGLQFVPESAIAAPASPGIRLLMQQYGVRYAFLGHLAGQDETLWHTLQLVCDDLDLIAAYPGDSYLFAVRRAEAGLSDRQACAVLAARQSDLTYPAPLVRW